MKAFAVDLDQIAVIVMTDEGTQRLPYRTKRQADKKIVELCQAGYTFDREWWYKRQAEQRRLRSEAHDLCNILCDKLYNWYPEPEKKVRLERVLGKARARLARRERI